MLPIGIASDHGGFDLKNQPFLAKSQLGVVPQEINLDRFISVLDTVVFQGGLYGLSKKQSRINLM